MMADIDNDPYQNVDIDSILSRVERRPLTFTKKRSLCQAPEFLKRLFGEDTIDEGGSLRLECKVVGFPKPTLRWFRDEEEITNNERYTFEELGENCYTISIPLVSKCDEASYKCKAENVDGSASSLVFVHIKGKAGSKSPKKSKSKSQSPSRRTVSFPPLIATIVERVAEEEKAEAELEKLPPSPLSSLYDGVTMKQKNTRPQFLGDWAFVKGVIPTNHTDGLVLDDEDDDMVFIVTNREGVMADSSPDDSRSDTETSEDAKPGKSSPEITDICLSEKAVEKSKQGESVQNLQPTCTNSFSDRDVKAIPSVKSKLCDTNLSSAGHAMPLLQGPNTIESKLAERTSESTCQSKYSESGSNSKEHDESSKHGLPFKHRDGTDCPADVQKYSIPSTEQTGRSSETPEQSAAQCKELSPILTCAVSQIVSTTAPTSSLYSEPNSSKLPPELPTQTQVEAKKTTTEQVTYPNIKTLMKDVHQKANVPVTNEAPQNVLPSQKQSPPQKATNTSRPLLTQGNSVHGPPDKLCPATQSNESKDSKRTTQQTSSKKISLMSPHIRSNKVGPLIPPQKVSLKKVAFVAPKVALPKSGKSTKKAIDSNKVTPFAYQPVGPSVTLKEKDIVVENIKTLERVPVCNKVPVTPTTFKSQTNQQTILTSTNISSVDSATHKTNLNQQTLGRAPKKPALSVQPLVVSLPKYASSSSSGLTDTSPGTIALPGEPRVTRKQKPRRSTIRKRPTPSAADLCGDLDFGIIFLLITFSTFMSLWMDVNPGRFLPMVFSGYGLFSFIQALLTENPDEPQPKPKFQKNEPSKVS